VQNLFITRTWLVIILVADLTERDLKFITLSSRQRKDQTPFNSISAMSLQDRAPISSTTTQTSSMQIKRATICPASLAAMMSDLAR